MEIKRLIRKNILELKPYSSARSEFKGDGSIFLDANENPFDNNFNRYPDPLQNEVKSKLSKIKGIKKDSIFLGNGSDEAIDLLFRIFCTPSKDNVIAIAPTYGMYEVCANINDVEYRSVNLDENFDIDVDSIIKEIDDNSKLLFLCSPNNPTGNLLDKDKIIKLLKIFTGIVVIDEAYIDFANDNGFVPLLDKYENMVILQTFSKAWGQASVRLGMAFASAEIIDYFNKVKYPYNINILTQRHITNVLESEESIEKQTVEILSQRKFIIDALDNLQIIEKVFPSDSNFVLAKVTEANKVYKYLVEKGIIVRNRSKIVLCDNCIRFTIGTEDENKNLILALSEYIL